MHATSCRVLPVGFETEGNHLDRLSGSSESHSSHHVLLVARQFDQRCSRVSLTRSGLHIIPVRERRTTTRPKRGHHSRPRRVSPGFVTGKLRLRRDAQASPASLRREFGPWARAHARRVGRGDPNARLRLRRHEGRDPRNPLRRVAGRNLAAQDFSRRERASLTRVTTVGDHVVDASLGRSAINEQGRVGQPNLNG
jgi:hypothetical protein